MPGGYYGGACGWAQHLRNVIRHDEYTGHPAAAADLTYQLHRAERACGGVPYGYNDLEVLSLSISPGPRTARPVSSRRGALFFGCSRMVVETSDLTPSPSGKGTRKTEASCLALKGFTERLFGTGPGSWEGERIGRISKNVCLAALWLRSGIVHIGLCCV